MFYAPVPDIVNIFIGFKKKNQLIKQRIILKMWWLEGLWFETFSVPTQGCNWSEEMTDSKNVYNWFSIAFHQFFPLKQKILSKTFMKS